jgi:hypothetical protein
VKLSLIECAISAGIVACIGGIAYFGYQLSQRGPQEYRVYSKHINPTGTVRLDMGWEGPTEQSTHTTCTYVLRYKSQYDRYGSIEVPQHVYYKARVGDVMEFKLPVWAQVL